jgi:hypothetical protein
MPRIARPDRVMALTVGLLTTMVTLFAQDKTPVLYPRSSTNRGKPSHAVYPDRALEA